MGTFSKSLASCGGVIAGDADVIEHLRIHARPFVFTASAVPAAVGAAQEALRICRAEPWRRETTIALATRLADGLRALGDDVSFGGSAIVAVRMPDEWQATLAWRALFEAGIYVNVGVFPAVPRGEALLRLSTTSVHEPADVDRCLETFARVGPSRVTRRTSRSSCGRASRPRSGSTPDLVTDDLELATLGLSSLEIMEIIYDAEDELGIVFPEESLEGATTVGQLIAALEVEAQSAKGAS